MNGHQIRKLREKLDLDPVLFSRLLGVHLSTVYRWEQTKQRSPKIDIMQTQLLEHIELHWKPGAADLPALKEETARHPLRGLRMLIR